MYNNGNSVFRLKVERIANVCYFIKVLKPLRQSKGLFYLHLLKGVISGLQNRDLKVRVLPGVPKGEIANMVYAPD
jgi:hypothetical protein